MKKILIAVILGLTLSACDLLVDKRISELKTLTEKVEQRGERFTDKEWKKACLDYANLEADFDDFQLTVEQADIVYDLKQRFRKACDNRTQEVVSNVIEENVTNDEDESIDMNNELSNAVSSQSKRSISNNIE